MNEKRYRLINFICLLAVYKNLIGTGRVLGTSILRYVEITTMKLKILGSLDNYIAIHRLKTYRSQRLGRNQHSMLFQTVSISGDIAV